MSMTNICWCFPPRSRFRRYRLRFHFQPHIVLELGSIKHLRVTRKTTAAHWHCLWLCESPPSFFLNERFEETASKRGGSTESRGGVREEERGEDAERAEWR